LSSSATAACTWETCSSADVWADPISNRAAIGSTSARQRFGRYIAIEIYATVDGLMCLSWLVLFHILAIRPYLQKHYVEPTYFPARTLPTAL
jgi:hypothetical protein